MSDGGTVDRPVKDARPPRSVAEFIVATGMTMLNVAVVAVYAAALGVAIVVELGLFERPRWRR